MSIFGALQNAANTFAVLDRAIDVVQNNITGASTPGFVRQTLEIQAQPFQPGLLPGGIRAGALISARDQFLERAVRREAEQFGYLQQQKSSLEQIESHFDVTGKTGVSASLASLYNSFGAWGVEPNSLSARANVLTEAQQVAKDFQAMARSLSNEATDIERQARATVDEINRLAAEVAEFNASQRGNSAVDPGREARLFETLEKLAQLIDITPLKQEDGSYNVLIQGQHALVLGDRAKQLSVTLAHPADPAPTYPESLPPLVIEHSDGADINSSVNTGQLGALVSLRNETLAAVIGGPYQVGSLNEVAAALADRVNSISTAAGGPAVFVYDTTHPATAASTIGVNPAIAPADLVASDGTNANGVPLALAALARPENAADKLNGLSFSDAYTRIFSDLGSQASDAVARADVQGTVLSQARNMRTNQTGVSIDEEALHLIEFQRAYEATARMIAVLDDMAQTLLGLVR